MGAPRGRVPGSGGEQAGSADSGLAVERMSTHRSVLWRLLSQRRQHLYQHNPLYLTGWAIGWAALEC